MNGGAVFGMIAAISAPLTTVTVGGFGRRRLRIVSGDHRSTAMDWDGLPLPSLVWEEAQKGATNRACG